MNKLVLGGIAAVVVVVLAGVGALATTQRPQAEPPISPTATTLVVAPPDQPTAPPSATTAPFGSLAVVTRPDAAAVFVDGQPAGRSPRLLNLSPGHHFITLSSPTYRDATREVQVDEGQRADLPVDLEPLPVLELLDVQESYTGRDPHLNAANIIRLGEFTDQFRVSDDVNLVVYLKSKAFQIRDLSYDIKYIWSTAGGNPIELRGRDNNPKDGDVFYMHTCAPAGALDPRGSGTQLTVRAFIDDQQVAEQAIRISGGSLANAPISPCDRTAIPRLFS